MALTITSLPTVSLVYTNNLTITATETTATSLYTYRFNIFVNGVLQDSFIYPANPITFDATIDLSPLISTNFESEVFIPTAVIEIIPDSIIFFYVSVAVYDENNSIVNTGSIPTVNVFNGCENIDENFDIFDYIMRDTSNKGYFLTNYQKDRQITLNDKAYIQALNGSYTGVEYDTDFNGITVTRYQKNGTTDTLDVNFNTGTDAILNIDISPSTLNSITPDFINEDTLYYDTEEINGLSIKPIRTNLIEEFKHTKFYNFMYVNRLGGTDYFTAVKTSDNQYKNKKKLLDQFTIQKTYNIEVQRTTTVLTQFICPEQSDGLQEMFSSPAVKLWFNGKWYDIRIITKRIIIRDRYPKSDFIQYEIEFEYNNRYFTQLY